jgi:hypothetical protein
MFCEDAMRQWHLLSRLRSHATPPDPERCFLVVEQLEAREVLSPTVFAPNFGPEPQTPEGVAYTFSGSNSFLVSDSPASASYQADLTASNGTITVTPTAGVTVTNNGTATVTVIGPLDKIDTLLATGVTFQPTAYYSGDATVTLTVTDLVNGGPPGSGSVDLKVQPVASSPNFSVQAPDEVWAPSSGFVFGPGFVSVDPWPDIDGSETVTVTFSLDAADPDAFTLSAGGVPLTPIEPGLWQISDTDPSALQATLDSLVLTPPTGFNDRVFLAIFADIHDEAAYPSDETTASDSNSLGFFYVPIRYFLGGNVTTPPVLGVEGGSLDLGGQFVASDPDEMFGDIHTLTLAVPGGTLTFDPALVPVEVSVDRTVAADGSTTIHVIGTIDGINQFLATSGILTYTPGSAYFSGIVPLSIALTNQPGPFFNDEVPSSLLPADQSTSIAPGAFESVAALSFAPVAGHVFPSAVNVTTPQDTPVGLSISVSPLADMDGSESVLIMLEGVPSGATLNHGTDLGGGQWTLSLSDLPGLTLTPPPGVSGTFTLTVKTIVTDSAPDLGLTDTATDSTTFTVTVVPAPVPDSPPPVPTVPLLPPANTTNTPALITSAAASSETSADTTTTTSNSGPATPVARPQPATFNAYASGNTEAVSPTETPVSSSPPGLGSLFAQVETPLPTYAYGEKHPLPPVLPLDQTLPVAGFSDSGGDSFALIDKLYRDAETDRVSLNSPEMTPVVVDITNAAVAMVSDRLALPLEVAVAVENASDARKDESPVLADTSDEGNWRMGIAGSAIVGTLAAWGWLIRGSDARFTRIILRLIRALHRRPTQRTA